MGKLKSRHQTKAYNRRMKQEQRRQEAKRLGLPWPPPKVEKLTEPEPVPAFTEVEVLVVRDAETQQVICPLCKGPISVNDGIHRNYKAMEFNDRPVMVHKVCPDDPNAKGLPTGQVWLKEGSPGSGRYA